LSYNFSNVGDIEGNAMFKLASLYEKLGDLTNAVPAYLNFCEDERAVVDKTSLCRAYMVLANYYDKEQSYDKATYFANKCLDHEEAKSEAKALLKHIANKREKQAAGAAGELTANVEEIEMEECDMVIETEGGPTTPGGTILDEPPVENEEILDSMDMSSSVLYD
jgi:anaphase-promoting complex subunit 8